MTSHRSRFIAIILGAGLLAGCLGDRPPTAHEEQQQRETVFSSGGVLTGVFDESGPRDGSGGALPVNAFLWRASLDVVYGAGLPLLPAEPAGGVIVTDWYEPPETPGERFKVNIFVVDRQLTADGVRARVFKQVRDPSAGGWADSPVDVDTNTDLENAILTRARELRIAAEQAG